MQECNAQSLNEVASGRQTALIYVLSAQMKVCGTGTHLISDIEFSEWAFLWGVRVFTRLIQPGWPARWAKSLIWQPAINLAK